MTSVLVLLLLPLAAAFTTPRITSLVPHGISWHIPDDGYSLVAIHFSINTPLDGTSAGRYNFDIRHKQGNFWVLNDYDVTLHPGDQVHYWLYAVKSGGGQQDLNEVWTYNPDGPATSAPTEKPHHSSSGHTGTSTGHTGTSTGHTGTSTGSSTGGVSSFSAGPDCYDVPVCNSYPCLIFEDNFDFLNTKVWEHEITAGGGGNWEFQYYTNNRTNSYTKNGVLYLKPTLTIGTYGDTFLENGNLELWGGGPHDTCTGNQYYGCQRTGTPGNLINPIQSARLRSSRGFNFKYGKVEIEAQLPIGDWLWPAIWMMPTYDTYGGWPASGEIDIMESRGNRNYHDGNGKSQGVNNVGTTLHFGPDYAHNKWELAHGERLSQGQSYGEGFHKYGLEWTENHIKLSIDGHTVLTVDPGNGGFWNYGQFHTLNMDNPWAGASKMAPFDQEFYLIFNVAVGGLNYFPDSFSNAAYPKPWGKADQTAFWHARNQWYPTWNPTRNNGEDAALKINYVRVWKLQP